MAERTSSSATALAIASGILGLVVGYFLGQGSSIGLFDKTGSPNSATKSWPNSYDVKVHADSSDEADAEDSSEGGDDQVAGLKSFESSTEDVKLVLVVRTDLGMTKGATD